MYIPAEFPQCFFTLVINTANDTDKKIYLHASACLDNTLRDNVWIVDWNKGTSPIAVAVV